MTEQAKIDTTTVEQTKPAEKKKRSRRDITKESVMNDITGLCEFLDEEIKTVKENNTKGHGNHVRLLTGIRKKVRSIQSSYKRVMKMGPKRKHNVISGFMKPIRLSDDLRDFLAWEDKPCCRNDVYSSGM